MICRIAMLVVLAAILGSGPALAFDPFRMAGIDRRAEARVPLDLAFRDETGARVTLDAVAAGKPILLAPVVHDCPNICGVTLAGLAQAVRAQPLEPGEDFSLVAFGIDPAEGQIGRASCRERV